MNTPAPLRFGKFQIDLLEHSLWREHERLHLPPKAFDLLALFIQNPGRLLSKEQIISTLWPDSFVEEANLANLIGLLRKTLRDSSNNSEYIQTVPKRGYRFVAQLDATAAGQGTISNARAENRVRIIVFPFKVHPAGPDNDYLSYSLPEAIAATLADCNAYSVRSIQLASRFDPLHWDPEHVAAEADVDVILTGTISADGDNVHAVTQLIQAKTADIIWSKVWDLPRGDLFRFHNGLVQLISGTLVRKTSKDGPMNAPLGDATSVPDVYELYLRANQIALKRTPSNMAIARDLYLTCTEKDPNYAPAWARFARCSRWLQKIDGQSQSEKARQAFETAFRLNPHLTIAHSFYTSMQCDEGCATEALTRLLRMAKHNENNAEIFSALVQACRYCGLLEESIKAHEKAYALDPYVQTSVSHTYFAMCRYEEALYWYDSPSGYYLDAAALASLGQFPEARALVWTRRERFPGEPGLLTSLHHFLENQPDLALAALHLHTQPQKPEPEICFYLARQASIVGDIHLAIELLRHNLQYGSLCLHALGNDPWFLPLRRDPQWEVLLGIAQDRERAARRAFLEAGGNTILSRHESRSAKS
jgi:DNA-binding winged helix-turn-helix (wHTH) protein